MKKIKVEKKYEEYFQSETNAILYRMDSGSFPDKVASEH
jgi:hypothetical protein